MGPLPWREAYYRAREHPAVIEAGERSIRVLQGFGITVTDPGDPRPMFVRGLTCSAQGDYVDLRRRVSRMLRQGTTERELGKIGA